MRTPFFLSAVVFLLLTVCTAFAQQAPEVNLSITARNFSFSTDSITVPAGAEVSIRFANRDSGIPHNISVYRNADMEEAIFQGQVITGEEMITYTFTAPQETGRYYFQCDIHPAQMNGDFIVEES